MFYRTSKVQFLEQVVLTAGTSSSGPPRHNNRYLVSVTGYNAAEGRIYLYSSHMKAGSTQDNQDRRTPEARRIVDDIDTLPAALACPVVSL